MNTETPVRITPKGWLHIRLGFKSLDETSRFWEDFTQFVAKQARDNGMEEGAPCLVLVEGGHCITAGKGEQGSEVRA